MTSSSPPPLAKFPRTPHLTGSRLQAGDEDLARVALRALSGRHLVIEEKLDGANAALSFDAGGALLLQSRGHYLRGGEGERQFDLFKTWAQTHAPRLRRVLGARYVVYGEWLYAKHTLFYDQLPHYFLEFDVLDREREVFLDSAKRAALLCDLPLVSAPILAAGQSESLGALERHLKVSHYKGPEWRGALRAEARERGQPEELVLQQTDLSDLAEGLYLKWEEGGVVRGRYKLVRGSFLDRVAASGSHWAERPILPNRLAPGVELFA